MRTRAFTFMAALLAVLVTASSVAAQPEPLLPLPAFAPIKWKRCRSLGKPFAGRLVNGTRLPAEGQDFFTWDPIRERSPNRSWRRYGCDFAMKKLLRVLRRLRVRFPEAPRFAIGDLSRPRGGKFGRRYGGLGHASHQSGVDIDVPYPRWDGLERRPDTVDDIDFELSQALVDALVHAGAKYVFVGPGTELRGRRKVVQRLVHHDEHLHVRFRVPRSRR